ncbi:MAG: C1 family peptidase [Treponema sp.]|nr:C1 family peptidase [Treponema sp.]
MKKRIKKLIILPLFILLTPLFAQTFTTGLILDPVRYQQVDAKPVLLTRNYTSLPRSISLKQFSPVPESQGNFGTCGGWAIAFAARTISESVEINRTNQRQSSNSAFSPIDAYLGSYSILNRFPSGLERSSIFRILNHIEETEGGGTYIFAVLDYLQSTGAVRRPEAERTNLTLIFRANYQNLKRYPIAAYVRLFSNPSGTPGTIDERVLPVKKSLAENKPVIIGMNTPSLSFDSARNVWRPYENPNNRYGGHAMCVVGYDDNMHGGAFEVMNSWGADWGNNGYIWITYNDFARFVFEAYEIIENLALFREATHFGASIEIELFNSRDGMPVTFDPQGFYRTRTSYPSGTDFRFLMTNKHPAYVYAFAADSSTPNVTRIFPEPGVSPVLDYTESTIAWPGEFEWIRLDDTVGTDYLIVLYSKETLDINAIEQRFANERGTFPERVARAVGQNFIPFGNAEYNNEKIEFSAESLDPKSVFGLLLAIDHRAR